MINTTEQMVWQSVRYALGRMSYAVHDTASEVIRLWPKLCLPAREVIQRDVEEAFERYEKTGAGLGMDMDVIAWKRVRNLWRAETPTQGEVEKVTIKPGGKK